MMDRKMVNFIKEQYPPGTRIRLNSMEDPYHPILPGTEGEVDFVDDKGQIFMKWDNGRTLPLAPGEDSFTVLPPKLTSLKLYMPLTADLYERNEYGDLDDSSTLLEGRELRGYQDQITAALVKNRMPEESVRGIMHWYLPPRVKAIVDAIVEELAKDERVSAAYETWQTLYEQVCLDYDQRPRKRLPLSQQKEFRSVRNMVIQETLQWIAERQRYADVRRTPSMQEGPIIKKDAAEAAPKNSEVTASLASAQPKSDRAASATSEDTSSADAAASKDAAPPVSEMTPTHSQPSGQAGQTAPAGAEYHAPTVGETVVRMLHHMSRIFEDNSKIDQIHRGLQIDRKRRQELQRKRLAMGHKPDDHEEQTFR